MAKPSEFTETTIYLLQKMQPDSAGQNVVVTSGYTTDWGWAETWQKRESPYYPRFVVPVKKMEGAP